MSFVFTFEDLSNGEELILPTEKDVKLYEENSWYISKNNIPDNIIYNAIQGATAFYEGQIDFSLENNKGITNDTYNSSSTIKNNEFVTLQKKELQALGFYPMISVTAAVLLFFNENYLGLGPFRTSSFPITNVLDDRKAFSMILTKDILKGDDLFLNYIDS